MSFSLEMMDKKKEMSEFVHRTIQLVPYLDYRTEQEELHKYQFMSHVNMYWILKDNTRVGVVKTTIFYFYDMGLEDYLSEGECESIFLMLEDRMRNAFTGKIQGNIWSKYREVALQQGWVEDFSRFRMQLDFDNIQNLADYDDLRFKHPSDIEFNSLAPLFIDAYSGGIDEKIGMLTRDSIGDSLDDILHNKFGPLKNELSIVVYNRWGKLLGASLITISEGCPFLVIIGVKKNKQGKGLGRKMLSYNITQAQKEGYDCMKLWVTRKNSAVKLYSSMGFNKTTEVCAIYKSRVERENDYI